MSPPASLFLAFLVVLLAFPTLLLAAAVPAFDTELQERDGDGQQSAAQGLASPFAATGNLTDGGEVGVYFCTAPFWNANANTSLDPSGDGDAACFYTAVSPSPSATNAAVSVSDPCVSLRGTIAAAQGKPLVSAYRNVGSFAPDGGVECVVYDADDCTGASLRITAPGFADLGVVGWARRVASYACVASAAASPPSSSGGSWFGGGQ